MGRRKRPIEPGYSVRQLAAEVGVSPRTIRYWVKRGALPKPHFRGPATRYPPLSVARVRVLRDLQHQGLELREIRRRLDNLTPDEIDAWAARVTAAAAPPPAPAPAPPPNPVEHAEHWQRIVLLPGLELHLRDPSGPLLASIAGEIAERYSGPK